MSHWSDILPMKQIVFYHGPRLHTHTRAHRMKFIPPAFPAPCDHAMRGAERSFVRVLLSFTPLRIATSMSPSDPSPACCPASLWKCCWLDKGRPGGLVVAWPLQDIIGSVSASLPLPNVGDPGFSPPTCSVALLPLIAPDMSGTTGVFTGMTGVRIGMGPVPPTEAERRADGFEEGVRRIVATPGVTITGPWPVE